MNAEEIKDYCLETLEQAANHLGRERRWRQFRILLLFFGDQAANAYAVDAATGKLLWKVRIEGHPHARIVGALEYHDGRVIVPLTGADESGLNDRYECCSSRGGLVALDAVTLVSQKSGVVSALDPDHKGNPSAC